MGLDLEMAIEEHYHEVMETIDGMLKNIFSGLRTQYSKEIATIQKQHPHEEFTWLDETLVLSYADAIKLLQEAGVQQGNPLAPIGDEDDMAYVEFSRHLCLSPADLGLSSLFFSTPTEKALGVIVKEKYNTDYYIIDKFPLALRPFYTMPDATNPVSLNALSSSLSSLHLQSIQSSVYPTLTISLCVAKRF